MLCHHAILAWDVADPSFGISMYMYMGITPFLKDILIRKILLTYFQWGKTEKVIKMQYTSAKNYVREEHCQSIGVHLENDAR